MTFKFHKPQPQPKPLPRFPFKKPLSTPVEVLYFDGQVNRYGWRDEHGVVHKQDTFKEFDVTDPDPSSFDRENKSLGELDTSTKFQTIGQASHTPSQIMNAMYYDKAPAQFRAIHESSLQG